MDNEHKEKALPGYVDLADRLRANNEQINKLIELQETANYMQEGANVSLHEIYRILDCTKKGHNKRGQRALLIMITFSIITLATDLYLQGETSVLFKAFSHIGGIF